MAGLNKVTYPQDARFSKNVLVIAPGLTVKSRLAVLEPPTRANYYEAFRIVPEADGEASPGQSDRAQLARAELGNGRED